MANLMISSRNYADAATLGATGGTFLSTLPLTNLQDERISVIARTNTLSDIVITATLAASKPVRVIALIGHNLTTSATWRAYGFTAPFGYTSAWETVWLGMGADESLEYSGMAIMVLPSVQNLGYWEITIRDSGNPDGHIDLGRLWIGDGWQPGDERGITYGCQWAYDDPSPSIKSRGGAEYFDEQLKPRVLTISHDALTKAEGMEGVLGLQRRIGKSGQALVVFDPDETGPDLIRLSMLCRRTGNDGLTWINPVDWGGSEEFREVVG
jgi:hypothetical protein